MHILLIVRVNNCHNIARQIISEMRTRDPHIFLRPNLEQIISVSRTIGNWLKSRTRALYAHRTLVTTHVDDVVCGRTHATQSIHWTVIHIISPISFTLAREHHSIGHHHRVQKRPPNHKWYTRLPPPPPQAGEHASNECVVYSIFLFFGVLLLPGPRKSGRPLA